VLAAVQQNGIALKYAAKELSEDREIERKAIPSLITLCEDDFWGHRMYAVQLLGRFADKGGSQAIAAVTKHLEDSNSDVRKAAAEALKLIQ
jgi:HEAT repeat protein